MFCLFGHVILSCYYRTPVDKDYNELTEQNCTKVVTQYGENKFDNPCDIAIAPTGEVVIVNFYGSNDLIILDGKFNPLNIIGLGGGDNGLVRPHGVAVTGNLIAVSDWGNDQVKNILYKEISFQ